LKSVTRRCSHCKTKVNASEAITGNLKAFCSYDCLIAYSKSESGQKVVQKAKRAEHKERKEKIKTRSDWKKEAQAAFNAFIRVRDAGKPCISCGNLPQNKLGGTMDAGHYRSRGSAPNLAFNLLNCHAQCVKCNRYLSGSVTDYRIGLINKIGIDLVEKIESDNEQKKMDVQYLMRIKSIFTRRKRIYEKIRNKKC
jgi:hypothetical protein